MSDVNRVTLSGRAGDDPEFKDINGTTLATFGLAVGYYQGTDKPEGVTWVTCNLWGTRSKVAEYIRKGMKLFIEGRLRITKKETNDGNRYYTTVEIDNLVLPDKSDDGGSSQSSGGGKSRGGGGKKKSTKRGGSGKKKPSF